MAGRSMTLRELNAQGIFLSELGANDGGSRAGRELHALMLAEMRSGLTASDAYRKVCHEHRDLKELFDRSHGRPLALCEEPSSSSALGDFIRDDRGTRPRFFTE